MKNKKILVMSTLLLAIILLAVGTYSYFRRSVNGNITGNTGILVFNVNGLNGETSETLEFSLNRSAEEPYVYPDDSGYFDLEITAEGSSTDVYVILDIIRGYLPDNLKFYTDEEHKVVISKKYFFFEKTEEMSDSLRIYWFWDGSKDDINDSLFINEELSARISLKAEPMEYGMMKNGYNDGNKTEFWQNKYRGLIKEITFTNDLSQIPVECTEENFCWDISYEENQKYPVYAYFVETSDQLYDLYITCSKTVFAPIDSYMLFNMFEKLENINFNNWFNTSKVENMSCMLSSTNISNLNLEIFNTSNVTDMSGMFSGCNNLTNLNLDNFNTINVTDMSYMFYGCSNLTNLNLDNFNTSNVTDMSCMFWYCPNLTSLNLSNFNTINVTDMSSMFWRCLNLTILDLSSFDTSNVTDMSSMFGDCSSLASLNLSNFNTINVTNMVGMFSGCSNLTSLNLSNFNTINVTNMATMFWGCSNLTTEITIFNNATEYDGFIFKDTATANGAQITVNYISETSDLVDNIIATKSATSNVVKGTLLNPLTYTITLEDDSVAYNTSTSYLIEGTRVSLIPIENSKYISSFKLNGELVEGNSFNITGDSVITDVVMYDIVIESSVTNNLIEFQYYDSNTSHQIYRPISDYHQFIQFKFNGVESIELYIQHGTVGDIYVSIFSVY